VSKVKASYGIHFNGNRLRGAKVLLPLDENGNPNWKYMTDFIKKLEHETASKALEYIYIYISYPFARNLNIAWKVENGKYLT